MSAETQMDIDRLEKAIFELLWSLHDNSIGGGGEIFPETKMAAKASDLFKKYVAIVHKMTADGGHANG